MAAADVVPEATWVDEDDHLEAFILSVEIDGHAHPMRAGFVHLNDRPLLSSDSPAALRRLATHAAELADRLEARHTPRRTS